MYNAKRIKEIIYSFGADLCGIASIDRFQDAPEGFKPGDIYEKTKSVIVFALKLPAESLFANSCVPYTHINSLIAQKVDRMTFKISYQLDENNIKNVIIPTDDPYEYWDKENLTGKGILSLKHAAWLAGLGKLGRSTLLINNKYGNMIQIGALLVNIELEPDEVADYEVCPPDCTLCLESCPVSALNGETVKQKLCRPLSNYQNERGFILKKCFACRKVCPNSLGIK